MDLPGYKGAVCGMIEKWQRGRAELAFALGPEKTMKTISPNKTYIDYTCCNSGVRVWQEQGRRLAGRMKFLAATHVACLRGRSMVSSRTTHYARAEAAEIDPARRTR
jgi:hypothetical protein